MKKIITLVLAMILPTLASAADLGGSKMQPVQYEDVSSGSWSGVYIGGHVGYGWASHDAAVYEEGGSLLAPSFDVDGLFGGFRVGADYQPKSSRLVFGVFGDFNLASNDVAIYNATVTNGNSYLVAGRVGALFNSNTMLYVLGGYEWKEVSYSGYGYDIDKTIGNIVVGGGAEYKMSKNVRIGLELQHSLPENETIVNNGDYKVDDEIGDTRVLARVSYHWNVD